MKLIVIGGGAAGFFCAITAAKMNPGLDVVILEKTGKLLSKVKVSGGGRCNVTHACFDIPEMAKRYPRGRNFVKKSFHEFFTTDTIQWFEERGVKLKEEVDGRTCPESDSSQSVIDCLMNEAEKTGVEILINADVLELSVAENKFQLKVRASGKERSMEAEYVCIASGGSSKDESYQWIRSLGHSVVSPVSSLFTFNIPRHPITELMGISIDDAEVRIPVLKQQQRAPLLITHWGLSGPAVLKLSAWCARELSALNYEFMAIVNWAPQYHESGLRKFLVVHREHKAPVYIKSKNPFGLPQRLWDFILLASGVKSDIRWGDLPAVALNKLVKNICSYELKVSGKTTFKEEFVTAGGVELSGIDPNSMMSRKVPNLYFAGEIMDVDGITGGYNFQHAWTSGYVAGKAIAGVSRQITSAQH
jgi:predicted Rossmann fold flavoprotein